MNLDRKIFKPLQNSDNGEVGDETRFYYHQDGQLIWAEYDGRDVKKGHLIGKQLADGSLDFVYHHINRNGEVKIGKCRSVIEVLMDGRYKLVESWQWLCDDMSCGESELVEVMRNN